MDQFNRIEEIISIIYLPYIHHLWYLKIFTGYLNNFVNKRNKNNYASKEFLPISWKKNNKTQ